MKCAILVKKFPFIPPPKSSLVLILHRSYIMNFKMAAVHFWHSSAPSITLQNRIIPTINRPCFNKGESELASSNF
jgi:hypothetical protein